MIENENSDKIVVQDLKCMSFFSEEASNYFYYTPEQFDKEFSDFIPVETISKFGIKIFAAISLFGATRSSKVWAQSSRLLKKIKNLKETDASLGNGIKRYICSTVEIIKFSRKPILIDFMENESIKKKYDHFSLVFDAKEKLSRLKEKSNYPVVFKEIDKSFFNRKIFILAVLGVLSSRIVWAIIKSEKWSKIKLAFLNKKVFITRKSREILAEVRNLIEEYKRNKTRLLKALIKLLLGLLFLRFCLLCLEDYLDPFHPIYTVLTELVNSIRFYREAYFSPHIERYLRSCYVENSDNLARVMKLHAKRMKLMADKLDAALTLLEKYEIMYGKIK